LLKLDPIALTDVGRRRDHNEDYLGDFLISAKPPYDAVAVGERGYLFAVADGMGGHASGEVASELAINTLFAEYYNSPSSGNLVEDLFRAIITANYQVHIAGITGGKGQMGTTLTLALVLGNRMLVGNVGDSRTYLIRDGDARRVSKDHSMVQEQVDLGVLTEEQAEKSLMRNVITRAIGHREEVEPDFFEEELQKGDVILLCSDGLHGQVNEATIANVVSAAIQNGSGLKSAAETLVAMANELGGPDNISVILIGIAEVGEEKPAILNGVAANLAETVTVPLKSMSSLEQATLGAIDLKNGGGTATQTAVKVSEEAATKLHPSVPEDYTQATKPLTAKSEQERSLFAPFLVILIVLVVVLGIVFVVLNPFSGTSPTVTPTVVTTPTALPTPTITPNLTPSPNTTPIPTVTPAPSLTASPSGFILQPNSP
jgi:serine/threonine protein phosphatase PrpC